MDNAWKQWLAGGALLALISVAGVVFFMITGDPPPTCPSQTSVFGEGGKQAEVHHIVLVDTTDMLDDNQTHILVNAIDREADITHKCERFSVFAVNAANPDEPNRIFSSDVPPRAADAAGWSDNPLQLDTTWLKQFGRPLNNAIEAELHKEPQSDTPLIESISALLRLYDFGPDLTRRRLVIVSDMLQNSGQGVDKVSHYKKTPNYGTYMRTAFGRRYAADLHGVEVEVDYLQRKEALDLQTAAHCRFWYDFFVDAGAIVKISRGPSACLKKENATVVAG